jgi:hypothetical protein
MICINCSNLYNVLSLIYIRWRFISIACITSCHDQLSLLSAWNFQGWKFQAASRLWSALRLQVGTSENINPFLHKKGDIGNHKYAVLELLIHYCCYLKVSILLGLHKVRVGTCPVSPPCEAFKHAGTATSQACSQRSLY